MTTPPPLFGPDIRTRTVGTLPIFGSGSYAHPDTRRASDSSAFEGILSGQFAQSVTRPGRGLVSLTTVSPSVAEVRTRFLESLEAHVFGATGSSTISSHQHRLAQLAAKPVPAMLACVRLVVDIAADGGAKYGDPFLTVLQAPSFAPQAEATSAAALWPGVETLSPSRLEPSGGRPHVPVWR